MTKRPTAPMPHLRCSWSRSSRPTAPVRALDGVSLAAQPGEFIALLGPNGAGKTTLFQLLSGLFVPDSGRIVVMGHDMSRDPVPALAELGIVFQQPTLDLELSVNANLMFHAGLHGIPRAHRPRAHRAGTRPAWAWPSAPTTRPRSSPAATAAGSSWRARCCTSRRYC